MSRAPLAFRTLGVRRMPGITDGGWELNDLSPGVNVVWGPNGSGKTTTASAMERILWPGSRRNERAVLDSILTLGGDEWRVEVDGATPRIQRNGQDAPALPDLPPATERDRYHLSLHELLSGTDEGLAKRIVHESAGGFDVAGAAGELGFRRAARNPLTERRALDQARARVDGLRTDESALRADEARLDEIRRDAADHQARAARRPLLERALERLDAAELERAAREALDRFPPELAELRGDEADRLRALRQALRGAHDRARDAARDAEDARRSLAATELPEAGLPVDVLARISTALDALRDLEATTLRLEREVESAREVCRAERASVAGAVGDDHVAALTLPAVEELLAFARAAEQHRAEVRAAEAELAWLAGDGSAADADALRRGRDLLAAWLREPRGEGGLGRVRTLALAGTALLAVAGAAGGIIVHPAVWLLAVVGAVLGWLAWSARATTDRRAEKEAEYARLGLDRPTRWEPDEVARLIDRIETRIAEARHQAQRAERRATVERRRAEMDREGTDLARRRAELAARIGLAPDADEGAVAWLGQRVHRWQGAEHDVRQKEAGLRAAREQHAQASAALDGWIAPYAGAEVASAADVAGHLEELRGRQRTHAEARLALRAAAQQHADAEAEAERCRTECASILARAGLAGDADARMEELCAARPAFVVAHEALLRALQDAATAERRFAETTGADDAARALPRAEIEAKLEATHAAAARARDLGDEAVRLEERLHAARERTEIEDALAGVRDAASSLRECRARDEEAVAGWVLKEFVERETRDRDRPEVFHHARRFFAAITRGRYTLALSDAAEFRAVDTSTGAGCALDELSRGTRVQLLLAVRIAFIETMETGARLPLVLDEALGNSDDVRAEAIMDAVIELARGGRQVFFLTARMDEAERWMARLAAAGVDGRLVDLAEARRIARFAELPRLAGRVHRLGAIPAPGAMSHDEYGAALQVPPINPDGGPDAVHLWYLADDPALLHRLLALGSETWGGLRAMVDAVGTSVLGPDGGGYARLQALGRALERLLESRRIGRGRRVDPDALHRSEAVSATFMERVESLRRECGGHPARFVAALDTLRGFRTASRAQLLDFLEREGYLDPRPPLDDALIRTEILIAVAPDLRAGHCTAADVERLLGMLVADTR